jgi:hypothetical protein
MALWAVGRATRGYTVAPMRSPAQAPRKFVPWAAANYATVQRFGALHPSSQQEAIKL